MSGDLEWVSRKDDRPDEDWVSWPRFRVSVRPNTGWYWDTEALIDVIQEKHPSRFPEESSGPRAWNEAGIVTSSSSCTLMPWNVFIRIMTYGSAEGRLCHSQHATWNRAIEICWCLEDELCLFLYSRCKFFPLSLELRRSWLGLSWCWYIWIQISCR